MKMPYLNTTKYVDPGTAGIVFNSIWPAIIAIFAAISSLLAKIFWRPAKKLLKRDSKNAPKK